MNSEEQQQKIDCLESKIDLSLKHDYHGNKYSLFIGGLKHETKDDVIKKLESMGVTDVIDVRVFVEVDRYRVTKYAEVHLFSIESVEMVKQKYKGVFEKVFPFSRQGFFDL